MKINSNGKSSHCRSLAVLTVASLMMLTLFPAPAMAYIDPGTGSFIIQGVIALIVGAGVAVKMFWHRIKAFFTGKAVTADEDDDDE